MSCINRGKWVMAVMLLAATQARAYTLRYKVPNPDAEAIIARVEAATGLNFQGKCATPADGKACTAFAPIHGHLLTGPGYVVVEIYQAKSRNPRLVAVKVDAALKQKIGKAVLGLP